MGGKGGSAGNRLTGPTQVTRLLTHLPLLPGAQRKRGSRGSFQMCVRQEVSHSYDEGCCVGEVMGRQHLLKLGILWRT